MDYFSDKSNPFYDRTCNNEIVRMQRQTMDNLNNMTGVEYVLLHVQEPILYVKKNESWTIESPILAFQLLVL